MEWGVIIACYSSGGGGASCGGSGTGGNLVRFQAFRA